MLVEGGRWFEVVQILMYSDAGFRFSLTHPLGARGEDDAIMRGTHVSVIYISRSWDMVENMAGSAADFLDSVAKFGFDRCIGKCVA